MIFFSYSFCSTCFCSYLLQKWKQSKEWCYFQLLINPLKLKSIPFWEKGALYSWQKSFIFKGREAESLSISRSAFKDSLKASHGRLPKGESSHGEKLSLMNSKFTISVIKRLALKLSSHTDHKGESLICSNQICKYYSQVTKELFLHPHFCYLNPLTNDIQYLTRFLG